VTSMNVSWPQVLCWRVRRHTCWPRSPDAERLPARPDDYVFIIVHPGWWADDDRAQRLPLAARGR
jgi:hypothetical protein